MLPKTLPRNRSTPILVLVAFLLGHISSLHRCMVELSHNQHIKAEPGDVVEVGRGAGAPLPMVVSCNATPCAGNFQYDGPNLDPNATEILRSENRTYWGGRYKIFFPSSSWRDSPEECIREWKAARSEFGGNGMSAYSEDVTILEAFFSDPEYLRRTGGYYMEIGGHNGVLESNSRLFDVCLGWDGLLVEPIPRSYKRMVRLRPDAHHLNLAPSCNSSSIAKFHDHWFTNAVANEDGATLEVHCGPLSHYLDQLGVTHIDFWSLDVEGSELAVLMTVDFSKVQINVIIAESKNRLGGGK